MHKNILDLGSAALLVVDLQEAFRSVVPDFAVVVSRISVAVRGFQILGVPVIVTEQYPRGLGRTAEEIQLVLPDGFKAVEKTAFSACGAGSFVDHLSTLGTKQVVICGLETHICVNQTAHDLLGRGFQVHVLTDCVCSRSDHNKTAGLEKMRMGGVVTSSLEMALFELMGDSRHEKFKDIQALIK
jgi:nicotinamidase-related amidase